MNREKGLLKRIGRLWPFVLKTNYLRDMERVYLVLRGLSQSEAQHSQIEMNLLRNVSALTLNQNKNPQSQENQKDRNNISYA